MKKSFLFVFNPFSRGYSESMLWSVKRCARNSGLELYISETKLDKNGNCIIDFPKEKCSSIWVAGGDGTFNGVVNAMARENWLDVPVGILPRGTANVLATEYGMKSIGKRSIPEIFGSCIVREHDLGVINGRIFLMSAGCGIDAEVMKSVNPVLKRFFGTLAYFVTVLKVSTMLKSLPLLRVTHSSGRVMEGNWFLAANASRYAGDFAITKGNPFDDEMECFVFNVQNSFSFFKKVLELTQRRIGETESIILKRGDKIIIDGAKVCQIDGEYFDIFENNEMSFYPKKLKVFVASALCLPPAHLPKNV